MDTRVIAKFAESTSPEGFERRARKVDAEILVIWKEWYKAVFRLQDIDNIYEVEGLIAHFEEDCYLNGLDLISTVLAFRVPTSWYTNFPSWLDA